jgi:hypothetical protein
MGGHPYYYVVPYRPDLQRALDDLRAQEFAAGRYNPVIWNLRGFNTPEFAAQRPGAQHASIDDAIEAAAEEGTRSILDIATIGSEPDYGVAAPLTPAELDDVFGTTQPTRAMIDGADALFDLVERGQCRYVILYDDGAPAEIFFVGYSYD